MWSNSYKYCSIECKDSNIENLWTQISIKWWGPGPPFPRGNSNRDISMLSHPFSSCGLVQVLKSHNFFPSFLSISFECSVTLDWFVHGFRMFSCWVTILFHWFSINARMKGYPFSNLILTVAITMIPLISSSPPLASTSSSPPSISECFRMLSPLEFSPSLQPWSKIVNWSISRERTARFTASKPVVLRMICLIISCPRLCSKRKLIRLKTLLGLPGHIVENSCTKKRRLI